MLSLLLTAAALAATPPGPRVVSQGLDSTGPRGSTTVTYALERALARGGVQVLPLAALPPAQRAAVAACALGAERCASPAGPDTPAAVLVGTLSEPEGGGVALDAELRSTTDGRPLERVQARAAGITELTLLFEPPAFTQRLARALGHTWAPEVRRDARWLYPGLAGLAAVVGGTVFILDGRAEARGIADFRGEAVEALRRQRTADAKVGRGQVLAGVGAAVVLGSAALWYALPQRGYDVGVGASSQQGTLTLSGRF